MELLIGMHKKLLFYEDTEKKAYSKKRYTNSFGNNSGLVCRAAILGDKQPLDTNGKTTKNYIGHKTEFSNVGVRADSGALPAHGGSTKDLTLEFFGNTTETLSPNRTAKIPTERMVSLTR